MGKYYLMASAAVFALTIQPASARSLQVGTCTAKSNFGTIQSAVDAAAAGDTVVVCPGDYPEEVTITKALTLRGINGKPLPRITIPAGGAVANTTRMNGKSTAAQVLVSPATTADVTIANIIVDGSGNNITSCGLELIGIYYRNAGGTVYNSTAQNQLLPPGYQGCQSGQGIFVENETPGTDAITVKRNTVTNFNKNGITFNRAAAVGEITQNTVVGIGPTDQIAQNGIQVGFGATAKVISNTVKNLVYTPATTGSAGILMYSLDFRVLPDPACGRGQCDRQCAVRCRSRRRERHGRQHGAGDQEQDLQLAIRGHRPVQRWHQRRLHQCLEKRRQHHHPL